MLEESIIVAGDRQFLQELEVGLGQIIAQNNREYAQVDDSNDILVHLEKNKNTPKMVFVRPSQQGKQVVYTALKHASFVVIYGLDEFEIEELESLLHLAIESKCTLVYGESLLFNPVVFPMLSYFEKTEITTLTKNSFKEFITLPSIFSCIHFLLVTNQSPLRNISAKGVSLNGEKLNMLHIRFEFENDALAVMEMTNSKPLSKLYVESAGNGNWMSLDLMTYNGQYYHYSDEENVEVQPPKQVYPKERNSFQSLLLYIQSYMRNQINPHYQFEQAINTAKALKQIEEQLRRGLPNFRKFEP